VVRALPAEATGRQVEVRETKAEVLVFEGPRLVGAHRKTQDLPDARLRDLLPPPR